MARWQDEPLAQVHPVQAERAASRRRAEAGEAGSALFVAVLMLALMGFLGVAALDTVSRDRQVAGFQNRSRTAFYAAEAAVAEGRAVVHENVTSTDTNPAFPWTQAAPRNLGDFAAYDRETSLPVFYGDPAEAQPIRWTGKTGEACQGSGLGSGLVKSFWQINVVGQSPDGSQVRLEVVESICVGGAALALPSY
jgi:hypothetical protein